ncbi:regulator of G-protein signaling loco isoform X3 [Nasonia vitripennis]|uniref:Regulator of G-protein signaling loco n=1 Tax=Nasonia vitripennis TaxID=7425 RepID=A0A7M7Q5C1_NASVI|nr:regulator of G-protein signaling loco isoform X3 [Nasonia vitripennis]
MQQQQQKHHQQPQHSRRKKKRVNYGSRTVELARGGKGFGFTISGQQPCILSCIVPGSPAELAGLRSGDYLVAVNGHGVGKAPHDDVVRLIGRSNGLLRLQIAEHYYSDSSEEDEASTKVRSRPRYRSRSSNASGSSGLSATVHPQCRVAKVVRDLQSGAMFEASTTRISVPTNTHRWNMSSPLPPPPPPSSRKRDSEKIVHRAVLGYLGTIDIPSHLHSVSMMSLVRKCIKRIKAEKRDPTTVLLTIHVANIKLANTEGRVIAEYPSYRIVYCNSFSNEDKLHFGILTKSATANVGDVNDNHEKDNASNSCHVFKIYSKLTDHAIHANTCAAFGFGCTKASELNNACQEFPASCDGLVGAIQTLYIADTAEGDANLFDNRRNHREAPSSPQPSNVSTSTAHSSNSDSGIGFKDECGCHSDRNLNVEFPSYPHERSIVVSSLGRNVKDPSGSKLTVRAISDPRWSDFPRPYGYLDKSSDAEQQVDSSPPRTDADYCSVEDYPEGRLLAHCQELKESRSRAESRRSAGGSSSNGGEGSIVSCPAVPSGRFAHRHQCHQRASPAALAALARSPRYTSTLSVGTLHARSAARAARDISKSTGNFFARMDVEVPDRLSPKVYTSGMKIQGYSMENLKTSPGSKSQTSDDHCNTTKSLPHSHTGKANDKVSRAWGSLQEIRKVAGCEHDDCMHGSTESCDKTTGFGVHTWAISFEKLLEDPKGLQTFAKYLKKEISHENIYFWAACERYSDTEDLVARKRLAAQIYQRHLSNNAPEPVNVDSHAAGKITPELLNSAPADLFAQAQKQVFNLMKFDSYPRFLRSDIYQKCLENGCDDIDTSPEDGDLFLTSSPVKLKKSHSDAEDRCRKSILPWHRKNRSKSKDRGESEYNKTPSRGEKIYKSFSTIQRDNEGNNNEEDSVSISSSRSSLASWDLALRQSFTKHIINLKYPSSVLASQEVEVLPTKVIKVDLPSRRVISVVAHKGRTLKEVLKPLLNKYGFKLDLVTIWADGHPVSVDIPAMNAPPRLALTSNNKEHIDDASLFKTPEVPRGQPTLDEITNKVFEELRVGKSESKYDEDEGSCKSDGQKSEGSSILSSKFFSRDSTLHIKKKSKSKNSNTSEKSNSDCGNDESNRPQPPLIAKWRNGVKLQLPSRFDGDGKNLYEGLKRAQRSRLEDQRGTEINFELPDFLKNKENGQKPSDDKKRRKSRIFSGHSDFSKFYDAEEEKSNLERCLDSSNSLDSTLVDADKTIVENGNQQLKSTKANNQDLSQLSPTKLSKPPPLPPKPKSLSNSLRNNVLPSRPFQRVTNYDKKTI